MEEPGRMRESLLRRRVTPAGVDPLAQEAVDDLGGPPPLGYLAMVTILSTNWPDSWSSTSANSQGVSIVKQALPVPRPNVSV